jgi:hypothetical protein
MIGELRFRNARREIIVSGISIVAPARDHILFKYAVGEVLIERNVAYASAVSDYSILIVRDDVVCEDEINARLAVGCDDVAGVYDRIVINDHAVCFRDLQETPVAAPLRSAYIFKQIIPDRYALCLFALMIVVAAQYAYAARGMAHYVVGEAYILDR